MALSIWLVKGTMQLSVFMIIGAISCVTTTFFMEFLLKEQKKINTIKKHVCQGFIYIDVLCIKIWMHYN